MKNQCQGGKDNMKNKTRWTKNNETSAPGRTETYIKPIPSGQGEYETSTAGGHGKYEKPIPGEKQNMKNQARWAWET